MKAAEGGHTHRTGSLRRFLAVFEGSQLNPKDCHRYPKAASKVCVGSQWQPSRHFAHLATAMTPTMADTGGWTTGWPTSR
jgi:hypothetical protein